LTFLKGTFLKDIDPHTPEILHDFGKFLGTMDKTLEGFYHSAAYRYLSWDLKNALHANQKIHHITDPRQRSLLEHFQYSHTHGCFRAG